jgi:hypothetical protein
MTRAASSFMVFLAAACSITACVSDQAYRVYEEYPPRAMEEVEILSRDPQRSYEVLGDFQDRPGSSSALKKMRKAAAAIGADALIVTYLGGHHTASPYAGRGEQVTYTRIFATAIRYK